VSTEFSDGDVERIDAAFNRVLAAEAAARERVEACRGEAERLVARAEERARRIASRADDRVLAVQRLAETGLRRALADLAGVQGNSEGFAMLLRRHLDAFRAGSPAETWDLREALRNRLGSHLQQHLMQPVVRFGSLAILFLDLERLRSALVSRAIVGTERTG
jgi:cell division septum initiation protein DivIVA